MFLYATQYNEHWQIWLHNSQTGKTDLYDFKTYVSYRGAFLAMEKIVKEKNDAYKIIIAAGKGLEEITALMEKAESL